MFNVINERVNYGNSFDKNDVFDFKCSYIVQNFMEMGF